ncbi:MAG: hypothetical protein VYD05_09640, partial [Planctomycetota bacterium]|nr:hypothetical protein [Planctomycetota bacterium]
MSRRLTAIALSLVIVACDEGPATGQGFSGAAQRLGPFGSLRDFVLVDRGGGLFVDRFEVTQSDWSQFASSAAGRAVGAAAITIVGRMSLPAGGMDLRQARAFARWRCGRL